MTYCEAAVTIPSGEFQPMLDFAMKLSRYFNSYGFLMGNRLVLHGQLPLDNQHDMRFKQKVSVIMEITSPAPISMPMVYCSAPWLKCGQDWHAASDGLLCWELPERWIDKIADIQRQNAAPDALAEYAATWCMNGVITLLCRQWYAYKNELMQWPPEWGYWDHGQKGILQYEREKRKAHK